MNIHPSILSTLTDLGLTPEQIADLASRLVNNAADYNAVATYHSAKIEEHTRLRDEAIAKRDAAADMIAKITVA